MASKGVGGRLVGFFPLLLLNISVRRPATRTPSGHCCRGNATPSHAAIINQLTTHPAATHRPATHPPTYHRPIDHPPNEEEKSLPLPRRPSLAVLYERFCEQEGVQQRATRRQRQQRPRPRHPLRLPFLKTNGKAAATVRYRQKSRNCRLHPQPSSPPSSSPVRLPRAVAATRHLWLPYADGEGQAARLACAGGGLGGESEGRWRRLADWILFFSLPGGEDVPSIAKVPLSSPMESGRSAVVPPDWTQSATAGQPQRHHHH